MGIIIVLPQGVITRVKCANICKMLKFRCLAHWNDLLDVNNYFLPVSSKRATWNLIEMTLNP